jgi:hypothetical protein
MCKCIRLEASDTGARRRGLGNPSPPFSDAADYMPQNMKSSDREATRDRGILSKGKMPLLNPNDMQSTDCHTPHPHGRIMVGCNQP